MKVLAFILLAVSSSDACFPSFLPEDYKFDCPAPNGKGLQDVFEKLPNLLKEFAPKLKGMVPASVGDVNQWIGPSNLVSLPDEQAYKNLASFLCENMHVDGEFYLHQIFFAYIPIAMYAPSGSDVKLPPKEKYREEFAKFAQFIRQSTLGKGLDKLLKDAEASDTYAKVAMVFLKSPEFKALKEKMWALPKLKEIREKLRDYKINEDDFVYVYTVFSLSLWERKT